MFRLDGPLMRVLETILNLMILNLLTLICSLPIFTAGAALTAMHRVLFKMKQEEEGYIVRDYFVAFKDNFKQATKIWLVYLLLFVGLGTDIYLIYEGKVVIAAAYKLASYAILFTVALGFLYIFPLIARYETDTRNALKNAYAMAFYSFFKSIFMLVITVAPWIAAAFISNFVLLDLLFGISLPAYICVFFYYKTFMDFEGKQEEARQRALEEEEAQDNDQQ